MHSWKEIDRKFNIWTIATDTWADSVFAQQAGTTVRQVVLHRQTRTICAAGGSAICLHLNMPLALLYQWMLPWTLGPLCCALSVSACHFALIDGGIPGQEHGKEFSSECRGAW